MMNRILPSRFDNTYAGHKAGLWLFYLVTVMTIGRSLVHVLVSDGGAQSIATIPLDQFSRDAAMTVIAMFGQWGLSQLLLGVLMTLVAVRYRSMVPLMFVLVIAEYAGRIGVGLLKPLVTIDTPPGATGNLVLIVAGITGLILATREADSFTPGSDR